MAKKSDIEAYRQRIRRRLKEGREAFLGKYKDELNVLSGLSRDEIDQITPDLTDLQKYDELITVVKEASRVNLSQAELKKQIEDLGEVAVEIAKKVPTLAALFA